MSGHEKAPLSILLIDHGSRRGEAHRQLLNIAKRLEDRLAEGTPASTPAIVEIAHMELAEPNIAQGFSRCVSRGAKHVIAIPCLLSRGRHVQEDIPTLLENAATESPGVTFALSAPLSEHAGFIELLLSAAHATRSAD
jgi:sirohydrochlorin ferrochelatase